jgi:hypothetical protein
MIYLMIVGGTLLWYFMEMHKREYEQYEVY